MAGKYRYSTLAHIVNRFRKKKLMVIGDLLLDQFIWGDVSRISPEAPVPVVWVKNEDFMPGGASNVASNLTKLGAEVMLVGIVGSDDRGEILKKQLIEKNIATDGIVTSEGRPTVQKTRIIAHNQQVVRIDRENTDHIAGVDLAKVVDYIKRNIRHVDGIIIEDYGKGLVTPALLKKIIPLAKRHGKLIAVDPKESNFSCYKGINVITPNHHEAAKAVGFSLESDEALEKAGEKLLRKLKSEVVLITLGERGMIIFEKGKSYHKIPTVAQEVFDVSGAGDTVIAVYTLSVISGASAPMAAHIANYAAGIVVGKVGIAVVEKGDLLKGLRREAGRRAR